MVEIGFSERPIKRFNREKRKDGGVGFPPRNKLSWWRLVGHFGGYRGTWDPGPQVPVQNRRLGVRVLEMRG